MPLPIEDDDQPQEAQEASQSLRAELAAGLMDQGVEVKPEDVDKSQPATATEKTPEKAAPETPAAEAQAPVSFSGPAKVAVEKLKAGAALNPDESRALVTALDRREKEINNGFSRLRELKELEPFSSEYAKQGLSVGQVLSSYHQAEEYLQRDFVGGINALCQRYQIDPRAVAITMAQQAGIMPNGAQSPPQAAGMTAQEREAVAQLVQHSQSLEREVNNLKQQVHVNRTRDIASQARAAGSSITGGPSSTPSPVAPNLDLRATLEQAFASYGSRV